MKLWVLFKATPPWLDRRMWPVASWLAPLRPFSLRAALLTRLLLALLCGTVLPACASTATAVIEFWLRLRTWPTLLERDRALLLPRVLVKTGLDPYPVTGVAWTGPWGGLVSPKCCSTYCWVSRFWFWTLDEEYWRAACRLASLPRASWMACWLLSEKCLAAVTEKTNKKQMNENKHTSRYFENQMQKQDRISYSNVYNIWLTVFKSYKPCSAKGKSHTAQGMKEKKVHNWGKWYIFNQDGDQKWSHTRCYLERRGGQRDTERGEVEWEYFGDYLNSNKLSNFLHNKK